MIDLGTLYGGTAAAAGVDGAAGRFATRDDDDTMLTRHGLIIEALTPVPDACGAGKWRGGPGLELKIRATVATSVRMTFADPTVDGIDDGLDAAHGDALQLRDGMVRFYLPSSGPCDAVMQAGDVLVLRSSGGGGLGTPLDRAIERVVADVQAGLVSVQGALFYYGVMLDPESHALDVPGTLRHRATLKAALRLPGAMRNEVVTELTQDALARLHPDQALFACLLPGCCGTPKNPFLSRGAR